MKQMRLGMAIMVGAVLAALVLPALSPGIAVANSENRGAPAATPCTPSISSIDAFQAQASQSVEIEGSCFGTGATLNQSYNFYLWIQDRSARPAWSACYLGTKDGVTCTVTSWTDDEITFTGFNGDYGGGQTLKAGDKLVVAVWNPQTLIGPTTKQAVVVGTASRGSHCVPKITSVGTFQPGASQNVDIKGSCLGHTAPYSQRNDFDLYIQDSSTSPRAWSACNSGDVNDVVTCTVSSWTNREIVLTGFGSAYGQDGFVLEPGDQIIVAVWNHRSGVGPGTHVGTVGSG